MAKSKADKKTVDWVISILNDAKQRLVNFQFNNVQFNRDDLGTVAGMVGKKISVYLGEFEGGFCKYVSLSATKNAILLHRKKLNESTIAGTILHEAVHAVNDYNKLKINSLVDEGMAYVAQMMYLEKLNISSGGHPIFDAAQAVYNAIKSPKSKNKAKLEETLITEVGKVYPSSTRNYDGIK